VSFSSITQSRCQVSPVANSERMSPAKVLALCFCLVVLLLAARGLQAQNIISTYAGSAFTPTTPQFVDLPAPSAAIKDSAGNTYVAAPYSTYVFKLSGGTVSAFAGLGYGGYNGDGIPANTADLVSPTALAIDTKGNIYIADFGNSRIRMVNPAGTISTVVGNGVKCEPSTGTCGDGGSATGPNVALNLPMGVAVDGAGNIYIADSADHRIRKVTAATGIITTIAGNGNICANPTSACGDGGLATSATLNFPEGIAVDSLGNVFIADTRDNRIREIPAGSANIVAFAGTGKVCFPTTGACGDGGPASAANFHAPLGLFVDPNNNIYVADSINQRVRFINVQSGNTVSTVAGTGQQGYNGDNQNATSAKLNLPTAVFLDGSGNLLISDAGNQRIRQVSNGIIQTWVGGGNGGDGGPATSGTLANPYNVAEDSAGNVYVADMANNRIRMITPSGVISTVAGNGNAGYTGDNGPATSATLNGPLGVAIDTANNIWIADTNNVVIREVNAATHIITTVAGNGSACVPSTASCGDGGPATSGNLSEPIAIALDSFNNLYIADYTVHRVREVSGGIISTFAGTGQQGRIGDGGPANKAKLNHPSGVAADSSGRVYISDSFNNVIRCVNSATAFCANASGTPNPGVITTFALSGAAHLQGDGGPALQGGQWNPLELSADPAGNVYIGGGNDSVVRRVDVASYTIGTIAGDPSKGRAGFVGDGGPATSAKISNIGQTVDGSGNLYIADAGNNRIRAVHLSPSATTTPTQLQFAPTPLHQNSASQPVTFKSSGGTDVSLTGITFGGNDPDDFSETNNCGTLPATLGVDVTCTVNVTFTPLSYALRTATLVFTDNGGTQTVTLSGYGPYFTISANPKTLTIPQGQQGLSTITVTPLGLFNGTVNLTCTGAPANSTCTLPTPVILDGSGTPQQVTLTLQTTSSTPKGSYKVQAVGKFGGGGQLQANATIQVTVQ